MVWGVALACAAVLFALLAYVHSPWLFVPADEARRREDALLQQLRHGFNISRGVVIALDRDAGERVAHEARRFLGVGEMGVMAAVNGSVAAQDPEAAGLPLYTRHVLATGRHDHMQIGNAAMLGCLLSHIRVWEQHIGADAADDEIVAVFEEDARLDITSAERMRDLGLDMAGVEWDLLMLESGHLSTTGAWAPVGRLAAHCELDAQNKNSGFRNGSGVEAGEGCTWQGTRGYLVKGRGARALAENARPIIVQVDALIGLVAGAPETRFNLYWTRENVAHPSMLRPSVIWDGCLKCMLPPGHIGLYVGIACAGLLGLCIFVQRVCQLLRGAVKRCTPKKAESLAS